MFNLSTTIANAEAIYSKYNGMSDDLKGAIITAIITGVISVIGFVVTNMSLKNSFKNELARQRDNIALEKMSTMPFEILGLLDKARSSKTIESEEVVKILNIIYAYGSEKAIAIATLMQKENYKKEEMGNRNRFRIMSAYILLATQIKMDVTGVCVNPEFWFKMRITDFESTKKKIVEANNMLVSELELDDRFYIDLESSH